MADETRNIIHNSYATRAAAAAAMGDKNLAMVTADNGLVYDQSGTQVVFPNEAMLADTTGVNGSAIIGTAGITGITPTGGSLGSAGSVSAMLAGIGSQVAVNKVAFTMGITGLTTSPTAPTYYVLIGNICFLYLPILSGTSNSTVCTLTGIPNAIIPADLTANFNIIMTDASQSVLGLVQIGVTPNHLSLFPYVVSGSRLAIGSFTASGTKGVNGVSPLVYSIY